MLQIKGNNDFLAKLMDETILRIAANSRVGITIIRRGYLKYFNTQFAEIFGYSKEDIKQWKKFEYLKIIHPKDIPRLTQIIKFEGKRHANIQFRGVRKNGDLIKIKNYIYRIKYNSKYGYYSNYVQVDPSIEEVDTLKLVKTKEEKKIVLDFHSKVIEFLEKHNFDFDIIKHCSFREEK